MNFAIVRVIFVFVIFNLGIFTEREIFHDRKINGTLHHPVPIK